MAVGHPEATHGLQRQHRYRHVAILAALAIADVHAPLAAINVRHLQRQALADPQAQAVDHQQKYPVAQLADRIDQPMHFLAGGNIRQTAHTWRADDLDPLHLAIKNIAVEELQTAEINLDRAPRILLQQGSEVPFQVIRAEIIGATVEMARHATQRSAVAVNRLAA